jgi:hypothetical protein
MKKLVDVVMLSTKKASHLCIGLRPKCELWFVKEPKVNHDSAPNQHLYFLSDEEIKESDWFINKDGLWKHNGQVQPEPSAKKIIATTDPELYLTEHGEFSPAMIGIIPTDFIQAFVKTEGEIDKVLLEEEEYSLGDGVSGGAIYTDWRVKLNPDGTVIWSLPQKSLIEMAEESEKVVKRNRIKELYTEEQVLKLIKEAHRIGAYEFHHEFNSNWKEFLKANKD